MNNIPFKKTLLVNVILIACVGIAHTFAVAAMIYQSPIEKQPELTSDAMKFDVMEMEFIGQSTESVAEAVEEVLPEVEHPPVKPVEIKEEVVAVKSAEVADIVQHEEVKKIEKVEPVVKPIVQPKPVEKKVVKKPQQVVKAKPNANHTAQQKLKGGKPLLSSSQIKFIKNPSPKRPRIAHRNRWSGNSVVMVEIDAKGIPVKVVLEKSSGHDLLDKEALKAAYGVKIHPYIENGQAIAIRHRIDYAF